MPAMTVAGHAVSSYLAFSPLPALRLRRYVFCATFRCCPAKTAQHLAVSQHHALRSPDLPPLPWGLRLAATAIAWSASPRQFTPGAHETHAYRRRTCSLRSRSTTPGCPRPAVETVQRAAAPERSVGPRGCGQDAPGAASAARQGKANQACGMRTMRTCAVNAR